MLMKQLILGPMENNCYLIQSSDNRTLYIIDPACDAQKIIECAEHHFNFEQTIILLTHAHADHIGAINALKNELNITKIMLNDNDIELFRSPQNVIMPFWPLQKDLPETVNAHDTDDFKVINTPGHTPGGVCYHFPVEKWLFSGDTLFYRSVGRTDLPGGSDVVLTASIREKLYTLDGDITVFPGHGCLTCIADEKKLNPYI
ncbi:MAG: MBL fold metallo-hydrolase [Lentisphaeria bacterium]|nr:MBL fold metallo-hydrolase [Lentisphaeria bacterium]